MLLETLGTSVAAHVGAIVVIVEVHKLAVWAVAIHAMKMADQILEVDMIIMNQEFYGDVGVGKSVLIL
jgi:hypothetical protein